MPDADRTDGVRGRTRRGEPGRGVTRTARLPPPYLARPTTRFSPGAQLGTARAGEAGTAPDVRAPPAIAARALACLRALAPAALGLAVVASLALPPSRGRGDGGDPRGRSPAAAEPPAPVVQHDPRSSGRVAPGERP